ncbi:putative holin-like toxin [Lactobacillus ultunensis]
MSNNKKVHNIVSIFLFGMFLLALLTYIDHKK